MSTRESLVLVPILCAFLLAPSVAARGMEQASARVAGTHAADAVGRAEPADTDPLSGSRTRPNLPHHVDTEHFRIWYATEGEGCVYGWPDTTYLHECKVAAERCWRGQVDTLGFRSPPPDGGDPDGGGGDDLYDVYIENLPPGVFGYCQVGYLIPETSWNDCTSYIFIENDYEGFGYPDRVEPLKMTIAHEFSRACQYSHDCFEVSWFKDATTVWCGEMMYDEFNWYILEISGALAHPFETLECGGIPGLNCGWALWNIYVSTRYGRGIMSETWYALEGSASVLAVMESVLGGHGTSLEDAFEDFWVWNWFTGSRHDGDHYEESAMWPTASAQETFTSYPVIDGAPPGALRPDRFACNYVRFVRGAHRSPLLVLTYDGPSTSSVPNAAHVAYLGNGGSSHYYGEIELNPWGNGSLDVEDFSDMSEVGLIVVNKSNHTDDMDYLVDAEVIPGSVPEASGPRVLSLAPNPFRSTTEITLSVPTRAGTVELSLYDLRGRRVATLVDGELARGVQTVTWDGTDSSGERVSSGVYFVRVTAPGFAESTTMVMLK